MMGFRPARGCHDAIRRLNVMLEREKTNFVLDADIKGFFDHLDHEHIIRLIGQKIKDPNVLRLVRTMLRSGVMIGFNFEETNEGSGQGSVCSPIIANIYMHYVLVLWFRRAQMNLHGYSGLVVYYSLSTLRDRVNMLLFYWLNRRSQRKSYNWEGFNKLLKAYPVVRPKIYVSVYNK